MARSSGSKKGLTPLNYKPSQGVENAIETGQIDDGIIFQDESDRGYPVNPAPPTTVPPSQQIILPPTGMSVGPAESFDVSVSGNGTTATYTSASFHGMKTNDVVSITGFATNGFNGTYKIQSYANKTFSVDNTTVGTDSSGTARNSNNNCGIIVIGNDGTSTVDIYVTFNEVLNASDYRIEVVRVD